MLKKNVAALLAAILVGASGAPSGSVRYVPQHFADCNAAALHARENPTVGHYQYRISARPVHPTIARVAGLGFRGTAGIAYAFAPKDTVMILPAWDWPNMTPAQRADLGDFSSALRNHELGHKDLADAGIRGRVSTLSVVGKSPNEVRKMLNAALVRELRSLYDEIHRVEIEYDRVTDHGTRQQDGPLYGFRGGKNVTFGCR